MKKFEVVRPWFGVSAGDVLELSEVHPSLKPHLREIMGKAALTTAQGKSDEKPDQKRPNAKAQVAARLKELGIPFDGKSTALELALLLPEGDPLKEGL